MKNKIKIPQSQRIDKMLSTLLSVSRNQIEKLIKDGLVKVNGRVITKTSYKLSIGDEVEYEFVEATRRETMSVDFDIDIIYEDDDILVVNKPSGLIVHPAPSVKGATLVDWLIDRGISLSTISGEERHGIVHRIDKETTGALAVAKNNQAHQKLSQQLQDKSMGRYYLALIDYPLKEDIVVDKPIARSPKNRLKMDIVEGGRDAKTAFVKLSDGRDDMELIVAKLYTGRTHQIRVHLATLGRHILGDILYGYKGKHKLVKRVNLHAYLLYLIHPTTGKKMEFIAPLYDDMRELISHHFDRDDVTKKIDPSKIGNYFPI
ncbi:Ribosomal large subunit pseudouridine synthase D [hydrothermal vent metagenome]|uniref:Ribosomal large subunit pseudouridine synthase D n=1 Tax=hydrothermal vent metagenome TaxID=652676 RepID=A0A1W1BFQ0_9ZZZZ